MIMCHCYTKRCHAKDIAEKITKMALTYLPPSAPQPETLPEVKEHSSNSDSCEAVDTHTELPHGPTVLHINGVLLNEDKIRLAVLKANANILTLRSILQRVPAGFRVTTEELQQ